MDFYQRFRQRSQEISAKIGTSDNSVLLTEVAELLEECRSRRDTLPTRDIEGYERDLAKLAEQIRKKPKKFKFASTVKKEPLKPKPETTETATTATTTTTTETATATTVGRVLGPSSNINKCISIAQEPLKTVHLADISNSIVVLKDIQGSLYLEKVVNSTIMTSCHQLRIHDSENVTIYVGCRRPIIEHCKAMRFANLKGSTAIEAVDDFSWLRPEQSQNWSYVESQESFDWINDSAAVQQRLQHLQTK